MEKTDQELLAEYVESGSDRIFEALVQRHAGMVFGAALRVTKSRELAEDTTQLVFAIIQREEQNALHVLAFRRWREFLLN